MKVAKWGNSLAVRIPVAVVEALELKEGDELKIVAGESAGEVAVVRDDWRKQAIERLRARRVEFPPDYKFDRDEANAR